MFGSLHRKLDQLLAGQARLEALLTTESETTMATIDDLITQVQNQTTITSSAVTLLNGLSAQLASAGTDPTKLANLASAIKTNTDALAAAVKENTPATSLQNA